MALSLIGGWLALQVSGLINTEVYVMGIRSFFDPFHITYALIKAVCFAFLIVSVSSYYGYYVRGGSLDVGKASTQAIVTSSVVILMSNFYINQIIALLMIEVQNIDKSFADVQILHDITTIFEKGKVNLIIGQSGQGKVCSWQMHGRFT